VFCFGSVGFDHGLAHPGDDGRIRLQSSSGGWQLNSARRNSTFGGANISWAFKAEDDGPEKVKLRVKVLSGWSSSSALSVVHAQLVVFVIDR